MATRMQQRRGLAAQWTAANPVLAAGEIGFETDTNKFKMGNGTSTWSQLVYFANAAELVAAIDSVVGMAPETLDTLAEIAAALGDNADFLSALATNSDLNAAILAASSQLTEARNYASDSLASHVNNTYDVHGIANTANLSTKQYAEDKVSAHNLTTQNIHGIADTTELATKTYTNNSISALTKASVGLGAVDNTEDALKPVSAAQASAIATAKAEAITAAGQAADTKVSDHSVDTTNVHGIADTSVLATATTVATAKTEAIAAAGTAADTKISTAVSALTKSSVGLANVDNTSDANKPVSTATQTALNAKLALAGGTMTGALTLSGAPTSDLHAATKLYVDGLASGINFHPAVKAATSTNISTTYSNGTSGYGATLTADANGAMGTVDGQTMSVGDRILVKAQTDAKQNGIYVVTSLGGSSSKWVITRAADADNNPNGEMAAGDFCFVTAGTLAAGSGYILSGTGTLVIGTDNINYVQFNAAQAVVAGTNISKTGSTVSVVDNPTFSGAVTASSGIVFSDGTQTKVGVPSITTFATAISSSATLAAGEQDKFVPLTGAVQITLPATGYSTGQSIDFYQASGTGASFASTNSVVGTPGLKFRTTNSVVTAMKTNSGWLVFGDLSA